MLTLSNDDRKQLREVIASTYTSSDDLGIFVDEELNENLAVIAGSGNLSTVIFELIKWAIAKGYIEDLILALAKDNPDRSDIKKFCALILREHVVLNDLRVSIQEKSAGDIESSTWERIDVLSEELELFLPKQFTFEADVGKLQQGLELAAAVCKITFVDRSPTESATGVLIAPGFVLTNYHVLSSQAGADLNAIAQSARFEFGYVSSRSGGVDRPPIMTAAGAKSVVAFSWIQELDYALIQLAPNAEFVVKPVSLNTTVQLLPQSPLNILQHPEGAEMKVSLSNNGIVKINEKKGLVLYVNPTKGGSSGSPCFDDDWLMVALHHKAMQTSFGSIREGILFSAIHRHIQESSSVVVF
jgi:endonuclease G, mitochondrial